MSDSTAIKFGHDMLKYYAIDPEVLQFNNGISYSLQSLLVYVPFIIL
jgi:hypothetical protein